MVTGAEKQTTTTIARARLRRKVSPFGDPSSFPDRSPATEHAVDSPWGFDMNTKENASHKGAK
eukprot:CAMPEP_0206502178 /NCGR_PEP_ID=MMETSP0324_2-20121206/53835_1 /ASSEMBLY_ACC=CAM_ASM_000836 /TAXON_ID=2866 /ORGANISM="Crypthecodinium cohnii, Strain Seligo" /LENGTH=62 /DNA_ID=CAMNT_0053990307 /DNA_START=591 /DNA_END=779 /DNA_ORIENTATION=-